MKICATTMEKSMEVPQKSKYKTTIWPSNSTPGYISKKNKNSNFKNTHTPMFIVALFTIAKIWQQSKCGVCVCVCVCVVQHEE